jgi:hypothetical protein
LLDSLKEFYSQKDLRTTTGNDIYIGAKITDVKSEQNLKGLIVYKLCRHIFDVIYNNDSKPFSKDDKNERLYEELVSDVRQKISSSTEDESEGILSSAKNSELIIAAAQIQAIFDNDPEKCRTLEEKYKELFNYWENFIIPDLIVEQRTVR